MIRYSRLSLQELAWEVWLGMMVLENAFADSESLTFCILLCVWMMDSNRI
jgi:hypothetical protein